MRWLLWCFCLLAESYETINHWIEAGTTEESSGHQPSDGDQRPEPISPAMSYWDVVEDTYVSSIFNDLTVLAVAAVVLLLLKFFFRYSRRECSEADKHQSNVYENLLSQHVLFSSIRNRKADFEVWILTNIWSMSPTPPAEIKKKKLLLRRV